MRGRRRGSIRIRVSRYVRRTLVGRTTRRGAGRAVAGVGRRGHSFLCFDKNIANVVGSNMNSVCNPSYTENALSKWIELSVGGREEKWKRHLRGAWKHPLACIQSCTTRVLDFFDFRALFPDHGAHARVGYHELDSDGTTARH